MDTDGQIITFYSYKGGTGRTMAVANTACLLARRVAKRAKTQNDIRVLAIDWDFEAPGLHRYFLPYFTSGTRSALNHTPGCINLLGEFRDSHRAEFVQDSFRNRATAKSLLKAMDFKRYLIATTIPGLAIMKSGRHDSDYARVVNAFDWEDFFYSTEGFFLGLADFLRESYDYILIDSRTGVTDTSGICTALLPDKLVVPFTANLQSLSGVEEVVRRAVDYRRQSEDWRPLSVFPLPSRIDISLPLLAEQWRKGIPAGDNAAEPPNASASAIGYQLVFERLFTQLFGPESGKLGTYFDEVALQHVPDYSYGEPIAVELETTDSRIFLRRSYEAFADRLTELSGPWESLEGARKEREVAALIEEARTKAEETKEGKDPKAAEDLLRLGFRIVEGDTGAANVEEMVGAVFTIAESAIHVNPPAVTLLVTSALDHASRYLEEDWRIYGTAMQRAGTLFDTAGIFDKAEQCRRRHLELLQRHLEGDNLATIAAMQQLSLTLQARSNLQEARNLQERVVDAKLRILGDTDPDTLASMNVLAAILQNLGDVVGARRLRERVDEISHRPRGVGPTNEANARTPQPSRIVRVFISSPGDVTAERERVIRVINQLNIEFVDSVRLEPICWETQFYNANRGFQAQIPRPSEVDLAIFIFWARAGTPLPSEFVRPDGTSYISGVEYELEDALRSSRANGTPDILVYRKTTKISFEFDRVGQQQADLQALEALWTRQFISESGYFKNAFTTFGSTIEFEELVEQHIRKWVRSKIGGHAEIVWPTTTKGSPFRGLAPFYEEHAPVFFGRHRQVEQIRAKLIELHALGCPFLLLLGSSSSGKTSLLRAGLVPRLLAPGGVPEVDIWHRAVVFRPNGLGPNVALGLSRVLIEHLPEIAESYSGSPEWLAKLFESCPEEGVQRVKGALERASARQRVRQGANRDPVLRLLIILDQLEEIFSLPPREGDLLMSVIEKLVRDRVAWVVAAVRSDAYGFLLTTGPTLVQLKEDGGQFDLVPPRSADIGEIIRGPSQAAGLSFEQDAETGERVDVRLERDASTPEALPLLELTLEELYQRRGPNNQITLAAYREIGGLEGAVTYIAEQTYASVSAAAQQSLPVLLFALVAYPPGEARMSLREVSRNAVTATPPQQELVDALVAGRLLISSAALGTYEHLATVRVAHEALFLHWPRARRIVEDHGELLRQSQRLEVDAAYWVASGKEDAYLLPSQALDRTAHMRTEFKHFLAPIVHEFIERSLAHERFEHEQRQQFVLRQMRRVKLVSTMAFIAVVAALLSSWYALGRSREAERQRQQAQAYGFLVRDATNSLIPLVQLASEVQSAEAAPLVAKALVVARELAKGNPDNRQDQDYLLQLTKLCEAVKCVAP